MNKRVKDDIFGEMEYKYRWFKTEVLEFWKKQISIQIVAQAYSGEAITQEERESYCKFKECISDISKKSYQLVWEYIQENIDEISEYWEEVQEWEQEEIIEKAVTPTSILFFQEGECVILCDCIWDIEEGIGIQVFPEWEIGPQDLFL